MKLGIAAIVALLCVTLVSAQSSRNGAFKVDVSTNAEAKGTAENTVWTAKVFDKEGRYRYAVSKEIPFDMQFPSLSIADNGALLVAYSLDGLIEFYSPQGVIIRSLHLNRQLLGNYEQVVKCSAGEDRAAILVSHPEKSNAELLFISLEGEELWRKTLKGRNAAEVFLGAEQQYVAAGSYTADANVTSNCQVFDARGNEISSYDRAFRFADIAANGMIVLSDRNSVRLFKLGSAKPLFEWKPSNNEEIVTNVRLLGQDAVCSVELVQTDSRTPTYVNPRLLVLSIDGTVKKESRLASISTKPSSLIIDGSTATLTSAAKRLSLSVTDEIR